MPRLRLPLVVLLGSLLLAAPAAAAECPGADAVPTAAKTVEVRAAVVCLTNAERAAAGLGGLMSENRLEAVAQGYAQRMVTEHFFGHVGPDGSVLAVRLAGYLGWLTVGENLAWGEGSLSTPRSTVAAWMRSPGHRANILTRDFAEVGVGVALGSPGGSSGPAATYVANYGVRSPAAVSLPVQGARLATTTTTTAAAALP
ncbi:MAG: CAP domain-containing protein, partial [Actinomycetota bacterium]|nr:CAP domain-containing protein [Actinomycetota bacterium]